MRVAKAAVEDPEPVQPIERLPEPIAYVVPFATSAGPIEKSHLVAVTRWLREDQALLEEVAGMAAGFIGHDVPLQTDRVIRSRLSSTPSELPTDVFAGDVLDSFPWNSDHPTDIVAAFNQLHESAGDCFRLTPTSVILREGKTSREGTDWLPNGAPYWQARPATLLVDLDALYRSHAVTGLRMLLGDLVPASGAFAHERTILDGRGSNWSGNGFLSAEASREDFQRDRVGAIERLGESAFRKPIHSGRRPMVDSAIRERADESGRTVLDELRAGRRHNLAIVLPEIVAREVSAYESALIAAPPRRLLDYEDAFMQFRKELIRKLRGALSAALVEDYLGDSKWWRVGSNLELPLDGQAEAVAARMDGEDGLIENILTSDYGRELLARADLTKSERRVVGALLAMEEGDTLRAWAEQNGISPTTASVHKLNAKRKLRKAMNLP